jgi:hypothetical protein
MDRKADFSDVGAAILPTPIARGFSTACVVADA